MVPGVRRRALAYAARTSASGAPVRQPKPGSVRGYHQLESGMLGA